MPISAPATGWISSNRPPSAEGVRPNPGDNQALSQHVRHHRQRERPDEPGWIRRDQRLAFHGGCCDRRHHERRRRRPEQHIHRAHRCGAPAWRRTGRARPSPPPPVASRSPASAASLPAAAPRERKKGADQRRRHKAKGQIRDGRSRSAIHAIRPTAALPRLTRKVAFATDVITSEACQKAMSSPKKVPARSAIADGRAILSPLAQITASDHRQREQAKRQNAVA
jgi:hypothetical protein